LELGNDRVDLALGQHEVAHEDDPVRHRFVAEPAAKRQRWLDSDAVERHLQIAARDTVAMYVALNARGFAKSGIDLGPVNVLAQA
jgi:hypothetical protein